MKTFTYEVVSGVRNRTYVIKVEDLTGIRFGRLVVLEYVPDGCRTMWRCRCTCGTETTVAALNLKNRHTQSCGCLQKVGKETHGLAFHPLYSVWRNMWTRCTNPEAERYPEYGGRGIKVCNRWKDMQKWLDDMGPRPEGTTLERKNVNGNYEPRNCIWADRYVQANNRRNNIVLTSKGVTATAAEWSRLTGIPSGTIRRRLANGWSADRAVGN